MASLSVELVIIMNVVFTMHADINKIMWQNNDVKATQYVSYLTFLSITETKDSKQYGYQEQLQVHLKKRVEQILVVVISSRCFEPYVIDYEHLFVNNNSLCAWKPECLNL